MGGEGWEKEEPGGGGRTPPYPTSLTSKRPGGCRASGGLSVTGVVGRTQRDRESPKPLPPKGDPPRGKRESRLRTGPRPMPHPLTAPPTSLVIPSPAPQLRFMTPPSIHPSLCPHHALLPPVPRPPFPPLPQLPLPVGSCPPPTSRFCARVTPPARGTWEDRPLLSGAVAVGGWREGLGGRASRPALPRQGRRPKGLVPRL